jgi:hypothetical protein
MSNHMEHKSKADVVAKIMHKQTSMEMTSPRRSTSLFSCKLPYLRNSIKLHLHSGKFNFPLKLATNSQKRLSHSLARSLAAKSGFCEFTQRAVICTPFQCDLCNRHSCPTSGLSPAKPGATSESQSLCCRRPSVSISLHE